MRSLFYANIIMVIILSGCASIKPGDLKPAERLPAITCNLPAPFFNANFDKALFRITMEIRGNQLTGLFFIMKMPDSTYRIVFSNEFGMTYFDLELQPDSFNVIYCFEPLNKKALLSILETDFRLLIGEHPFQRCKWYQQEDTGHKVCFVKHGKYKTWSTFSTSCDTLLIKAASSNFFDKTTINYQAYRDKFPSKIQIRNPVIHLDLKLTLLSK